MKSLTVLRLVAVTHAVATFLQPVLAGSYLSGHGSAMRIHQPVGMTLAFLALLQLLMATVWWRSGGPGRPVLLAAAIVVAEGVQIGLGFSRQLALHIPLGISIVLAAVVFAGWIFRPAASSRRPADPATVPA